MSSTEWRTSAEQYAHRETQGRALREALQEAYRDEDDEECVRVSGELRALGYIVEWTSSGWMVSR